MPSKGRVIAAGTWRRAEKRLSTASKMRINAAGSDLEADKLEELGRFEDDSSRRYVQMKEILLIMAGNWKRFIAGNWKSFFIFLDSISNRQG